MILEKLKKLAQTTNTLILLTGPVGSGKKTMVKKLAKELGWLYLPFEGRIEAIRDINSITHEENMIVCLENGNDITIQAQNALLKIAEEPPKNMRIIICATSVEVLLPTIQTRSIEVEMPQITKEDLENYLQLKKPDLTQELKNKIVSACYTYSDINDILELDDINHYFDFCLKVVDNIGKVSTPNAFAILNSLNLKNLKIGLGCVLFLNGVKYHLFEKTYCRCNLGVICVGIKLINKCKKYIEDNVNETMVMTHFITEMRSILKENGVEDFNGIDNT